MALDKNFHALFVEAMQQVTTLSANEVKEKLSNENVTLVDIRDIRELWKEGTIKGSVHAPRGMLEAWIDPESPYFKKELTSGKDKEIIFFCAGGVRSALAAKTVQDMGVENIAHMEGGYAAWVANGFDTMAVEKK